ncbi:hypothetical protein [Streptomyces candidus]|uniref:Uncharacterized protein n=1 Tax=Streptomyces candidus TaxID=67283 RepID=A0A7X0HBE3_9ACTN|nr:hypothetical protein [Streptomyces candidus]MBB6434537.1 hypothetical protein [Streptomyces candidus]GHH36373.1 hypothetical protein GCM10018773_11200 [Streptomyces candidus]
MTYFMYDVHGNAVDEPDADTVRRLVQEGLAATDTDNPDVSLTHESGWSLSAFAGGLLLWENVEDETAAAGSLDKVAEEEVLRLFALLSGGEVEKVAELDWQRAA